MKRIRRTEPEPQPIERVFSFQLHTRSGRKKVTFYDAYEADVPCCADP